MQDKRIIYTEKYELSVSYTVTINTEMLETNLEYNVIMCLSNIGLLQ